MLDYIIAWNGCGHVGKNVFVRHFSKFAHNEMCLQQLHGHEAYGTAASDPSQVNYVRVLLACQYIHPSRVTN